MNDHEILKIEQQVRRHLLLQLDIAEERLFDEFSQSAQVFKSDEVIAVIQSTFREMKQQLSEM